MTADKKLPNYCFIDGQNLHYSTKEAVAPWKIDYAKLRRYLSEQYQVVKAYYFIGVEYDKHRKLYQYLRDVNYEVEFTDKKTKNKGNVDMDIVLGVMKKLVHEPAQFDKIILISGDGDFKQLVNYLIETDRFKKIMFPNKERRSRLYKRTPRHYIQDLSHPDMRKVIEYKK